MLYSSKIACKKSFVYKNILEKSLQISNLSAVEGKELYKITYGTLETMKTEDFEKNWEKNYVLGRV